MIISLKNSSLKEILHFLQRFAINLLFSCHSCVINLRNFTAKLSDFFFFKHLLEFKQWVGLCLNPRSASR